MAATPCLPAKLKSRREEDEEEGRAAKLCGLQQPHQWSRALDQMAGGGSLLKARKESEYISNGNKIFFMIRNCATTEMPNLCCTFSGSLRLERE